MSHKKTIIIGYDKYFINDENELKYAGAKKVEYWGHQWTTPLNEQTLNEAREALNLGIIDDHEVPVADYGQTLSEIEYEKLVNDLFLSDLEPEYWGGKGIEPDQKHIHTEKKWTEDNEEYQEKWVHVIHDRKVYRMGLSIFSSFGSGDPEDKKFAAFLAQHPRGAKCIEDSKKSKEDAKEWRKQNAIREEERKAKRIEYLKKKFGKA